jgi:hypothetical protein
MMNEWLGFKIVDEMVLGKGKVGADGLECKGGEGVMIWGMIWDGQDDRQDDKQVGLSTDNQSL